MQYVKRSHVTNLDSTKECIEHSKNHGISFYLKKWGDAITFCPLLPHPLETFWIRRSAEKSGPKKRAK